MTSTPITSLALATGASQNVTVVDQSGAALPNTSISWTGTNDLQINNVLAQLTITDDPVNGGFVFHAVAAITSTLTATHGPSGKKATIPLVITNPVTALSFTTVSA